MNPPGPDLQDVWPLGWSLWCLLTTGSNYRHTSAGMNWYTVNNILLAFVHTFSFFKKLHIRFIRTWIFNNYIYSLVHRHLVYSFVVNFSLINILIPFFILFIYLFVWQHILPFTLSCDTEVSQLYFYSILTASKPKCRLPSGKPFS